jgi:Ser/Thr protein kinase RdoA (MazF antagonist)
LVISERLRSCLADHWGLTGATVHAHHGGMNSSTWFVTAGGERRVAKAVAAHEWRSFVGGLTVAGHVEAAGIPAGAPVPTRHGDLVADLDGTPLALLTWVDGDELTGSDQELVGRTLGRVHEALRYAPVTPTDRFHWVDVDAPHLAIRPWIRPSVTAAVAAYEAVGDLSHGLLHLDPAPEAFRQSHGVCGLIDWAAAMRGPLLYDLASAVMYVGGPGQADSLIDAYLESRTIPEAELAHGLPVMLRFRWAVQADYFARRLATGDLTGIASAADNEKGLADAFRGLHRSDV